MSYFLFLEDLIIWIAPGETILGHTEEFIDGQSFVDLVGSPVKLQAAILRPSLCNSKCVMGSNIWLRAISVCLFYFIAKCLFSIEDLIIWVAPGETILGHTEEFIGGRHNVTTMMKARSSMGRNFIEVCKCAGWGDVGMLPTAGF